MKQQKDFAGDLAAFDTASGVAFALLLDGEGDAMGAVFALLLGDCGVSFTFV